MIALLLLFGFVNQSLAQSNSTALEGWQLDDNTRSSWDIFWTCVSTILACTWTALHISVPTRTETQAVFLWWKAAAWVGTILAPEFMAGTAAEELWQARSAAARCNDAFRIVNSEGGDSGSSEVPKTPKTEEFDGRWGTVQGFCLGMNGVLLQTKDDWTYPVHCSNVVALIKTRVIKPSHLRTTDIQDRAKADSFAKGFSLLQAFWVTCNVIARRAYNMPITALEIATVAYISCAAATYVIWWNKPKDMVTPITIYLPYDRDSESLPPQVRDILDAQVENWVHSDAIARDTESPVWQIIVTTFRFQLHLLSVICAPWSWNRNWEVLKDKLEVRIRNATAKPSDASNGSHQDEESPRQSEEPSHANPGSHIDRKLCDEPEPEPVNINGDYQDEEIPHGVIAASGPQQPSNEPKVDGILARKETSQGKELSRKPSEASRNGHRELETLQKTHKETELESKTQKMKDSMEDDEKLTIMEWTNITHFYMFSGLVFCGIHVAAWNSTFPTQAEQIVWRVFSLVALFITWPLYLRYLWSFHCLRRTLDDKEERVSSASWSKPSDLFWNLMWFCCYATARWGSVILMFISLRALPAGSYITVDWLSSIPHI
ncbi:hypothetical protein N7537_000945 [Penicillium hordei]|uniref:Uncharacterized protein n=1 Tax=Penicillium hordei TaxID=40994 RepID=A0AAD6EF75_9EURO|nr:uncharacterized protein N7537_000945 [Penicillium hordei]KAJ5615831.1 hypothetical protein N7537_000945 [Penicillium hordei]